MLTPNCKYDMGDIAERVRDSYNNAAISYS